MYKVKSVLVSLLVSSAFVMPVYAMKMKVMSAHQAAQGVSQKVNINKADERALQHVKGLGEIRAKAIVAYREAHGPFASIQDLSKVKGLGEKRIAQIAEHVTV